MKVKEKEEQSKISKKGNKIYAHKIFEKETRMDIKKEHKLSEEEAYIDINKITEEKPKIDMKNESLKK